MNSSRREPAKRHQKPKTVGLPVEEALELLHAQLTLIGRAESIPLFFVKGPGAGLQNLRPAKISSDVDVVVRPEGFESLEARLRTMGWRRRPVDPDADRYPNHSVTFYSDYWPIDIDVHYRMPGIEASSDLWMAEVLEAPEFIPMAGQRCPFPTRIQHALILVLHGLRDHSSQAANPDLKEIVSRGIDIQALMSIAERWEALAAIKDFVEADFPEFRPETWPQPSDEWTFRMYSQTGMSNRIIALSKESPWKWIPSLFRDLFPSKEAILAENLRADVSPKGRMNYYFRRIRRGIARLPWAVRDFAEYRKNISR